MQRISAEYHSEEVISLSFWRSVYTARIGLKSTVRHYKTTQFNIKILTKYTQFSILQKHAAKFYIVTLRAERAEKNNQIAPPPPPIWKMDRRPC